MDNLHTADCRHVAAVLGIDPFYVVTTTSGFTPLSDSERRYMHLNRKSGVIAFTTPVADLMFKSHLRYEWRGRGCCVVFCESPLNMTRKQRIGLAIHEIAHYVASFDNEARDDANHERAVKTSWQTMQPEEEHHDRRWLRSLVHCWHRVCAAGLECPLGDVLNLEQYGYTKKDLAPLLSEASNREGEPVEAILASPQAGTKRKKRHRKPKPRTEPNVQKPKAPPTHRRQRQQTSGPMNGWLYVHRDGSCTFNGKRYVSEPAFHEARQTEQVVQSVEERARERSQELQVEQRAAELAGITATAPEPKKPTRDQIRRAVLNVLTSKEQIAY